MTPHPAREPKGSRPPGTGDPAPRRAGCRHVWVEVSGGYHHPGLLLAWRRDTAGWSAQVAVVQDPNVLVDWYAASRVWAVRDDRWEAGA